MNLHSWEAQMFIHNLNTKEMKKMYFVPSYDLKTLRFAELCVRAVAGHSVTRSRLREGSTVRHHPAPSRGPHSYLLKQKKNISFFVSFFPHFNIMCDYSMIYFFIN